MSNFKRKKEYWEQQKRSVKQKIRNLENASTASDDHQIVTEINRLEKELKRVEERLELYSKLSKKS